MDAGHFDRLARTLSIGGTRRAALSTLLAAAGTAFGLSGAQRTAAQTSCSLKANRVRCQSGAECCSGFCKRKRGTDKKFCRQANHQGVCTIEENQCDGGSDVCGTQNGVSGPCFCYRTTTGRSFCGNDAAIQPDDCDCTSDAQCENRVRKGAKCVDLVNSGCIGCLSGVNSGCMAPCRFLTPRA